MKKTLTLLLIVEILSFTGNAQEKQKIILKEISNNNGFEKACNYWIPNSGKNRKNPGGIKKIVKNGRSGNCLKVKNTPTSQFVFFSKSLIPVKQNGDIIKITIYLKGKGKFRAGFYCYDKNKKYVTTFFSKNFTKINSTKWTKKDFTYDFKILKGKKFSNVRVAFEIKENSDLLFDDFCGILESKILN